MIVGFLSAGLIFEVAIGGGADYISPAIVNAAARHQLGRTIDGERLGIDLYFNIVKPDLDFWASAARSVEGLAKFGAA